MPNPKNYKTEKEFISACIPKVLNEGTAKDSEQASAICFSMWRDRNKKMMKLETVNIKGAEIFEQGNWKGIEYTEQDIDEIINNFENKTIDPYITIDHSDKATQQMKDALQAMSLGFVDKLYKQGKKLVADFKQVPKVIGELIESGALKKRSIELYKKYISADGKKYNNVLQAVTFHGANGVPALNTLSDFVALYKNELNTIEHDKKNEVIELKQEDFKKEVKMDKIELDKSEYENLLKFKSDSDKLNNDIKSKDDMIVKMKSEIDTVKAENETLKKVQNDFIAFKSEYEKKEKEMLNTEADKYITDQINAKKVMPASKEMYIENYKMYKAMGVDKLQIFKDDIEKRNEMLPSAEKDDKTAEVNFKNMDELNTIIETKMKKEGISFEKARKEILREV